MNRRVHPVDAQIRRLPLPSDEQAAAMTSPTARQALLERITDHPVPIDRAPAQPSALRPRIPRRTLVLVTLLVTMGVAAVGGATVTRLVANTTTVACHTDDRSVTVTDSLTGDPVEDCIAAWQEQGVDPPSLRAYDNGRGGIEVLPAAQPPQPGWMALEPGVAQDPRLIQLDAALDDYGRGLPSGCHRAPAARAIVDRELARLGLDTWKLRGERGEADGTATCTAHYLDPAERQVVLFPVEHTGGAEPFVEYAGGLAEALERTCSSVAGAATAARELAAHADLVVLITEIADEDLPCARSDVNVGGRIEVIIRGPAEAS